MKITKDGFVWLTITEAVAWQVFGANVFEVYELHEDESESLLSTPQSLQEAIDNGAELGIEVGHVFKEVYLLYTTDGFHSLNSKDLLGVFTRHALAVKCADEHSKTSEEGELSKYDVLMLGDTAEGIKQTQGRQENYLIVTETLNEEIK